MSTFNVPPCGGVVIVTPLIPAYVCSSLDELLAGATGRTSMKTGDSLSGAMFERVLIDGSPHVVKYLHVDNDWLQRSTGDLRCRPVQVWRSGVLHALTDCIDTAIVGVAEGLGRNGWGAALLMRDVSEHLIPEGDERIDAALYEEIIDDIATLHSAFHGRADLPEITPITHRALELVPWVSDVELARGGTDVVPPMLRPGWERLRDEAPKAGRIAWSLLDDLTPLVVGLSEVPHTFIHGDLKFGNIGRDELAAQGGGRTILLDWAMPGRAPGAVDIGWFIAVNCDRLPTGVTKDDVLVHYRAAMLRRGLDVAGWWDRAMDFALMLAFLQLGWSKSGDELDWWADQVARVNRAYDLVGSPG